MWVCRTSRGTPTVKSFQEIALAKGARTTSFAPTAFVDQTHDESRRAKPRNRFYIIVCGKFESKFL